MTTLTLDSLIKGLDDLFSGDGSQQDQILERLVPSGAGSGRSPSRAPDAAVKNWRALLRQMPVDKRSFNDIYAPHTLDSMIESLGKWWLANESCEPALPCRDRAIGFLGLLLVTWLGLIESDARRNLSHSGPGSIRRESHDCDLLCRPVLANPMVQRAIRDVYRPDPVAGGKPGKTWEMLEFDTLKFHRHGTTSVILAASGGISEQVAVKLILLPFLRIRSIERETMEYYARYHSDDYSQSSIVGVLGSTQSWILMEFVAGLTLRELLDRPGLLAAKMADPEATLSSILRQHVAKLARENPSRAGARDGGTERPPLDELLKRYDRLADAARSERRPEANLIWMRNFGDALFTALSGLQGMPGRFHGDLTPSNIIMGDAPGINLTLIDLGRNYLYTQSMPGTGSVDSTFTAPEARGDASDLSLADVYSLGQLLVCVGVGGHVQPDAIVPDIYYSKVPFIARFLEDLIQESPGRRLAVFRRQRSGGGQGWAYEELQRVFAEELAAVEAAEGYRLVVAEESWLSIAADLVRPMKSAPVRQFHLWRIRRKQALYLDRDCGARVRGLFIWSWISVVGGAIGFATVATWFMRDAGWDWSGNLMIAVQKAFGSGSSQVPLIDHLRVAGYRVPDLKGNWPARAVGFSYVMIGARYYQALFAGLSPTAGSRFWRCGWRSITSESLMRLETVTAMILVVGGTLTDSPAWPIITAFGQTIALLCNWATFTYVQYSLVQARKSSISTVPKDNTLTGYALFKSWLPGSIFYCTVLWLVGLLLYWHFLHDTAFYAIAAAAANIFVMYLIKCGIDAPPIRVCLTRACLAAERVRATEGASRI
jgi:serine/threonine protein kinase